MKTKKESASEGLDPAMLGRMAEVLRILAHPDRLRIVDFLEAKGSAPVHALMEGLDLAQAPVSQHVNQMRRVGILHSERRGREIWYALEDARALTILGCMRKHKRGEG